MFLNFLSQNNHKNRTVKNQASTRSKSGHISRDVYGHQWNEGHINCFCHFDKTLCAQDNFKALYRC